jgi:hypothetical protein
MLRYAQHDKVLPVPIDPSDQLPIQLERHKIAAPVMALPFPPREGAVEDSPWRGG